MTTWIDSWYGGNEICSGGNGCQNIIKEEQKKTLELNEGQLNVNLRWAYCSECLRYYCPNCKQDFGTDSLEFGFSHYVNYCNKTTNLNNE